MRDNKGNLSFCAAMLMLMGIVIFSSLTFITSVTVRASKPSKSILNTYEMNLLERVAIEEMVEQLEGSTSSVPLIEDTSTEDYEIMISEIHESVVDEDGLSLYISPKIRVHETPYTDEISLDRILTIVDDEYYTEKVWISEFDIDYGNSGTILNFKDGDVAYLEPVMVTVSIVNGGYGRMSTYSVSNLYATFSHNDETSIIMYIKTDNVEIRREVRNEFQNTE